MKYYFAPLEGLTDSIYRRLHHKYFPGIDRYYTPFFSPTVHRALTAREKRELPPAEDLDVQVIPQILTKSAPDFIWMSTVCRDRGYSQINLNLGCPSGTVTAKGKGSGMLRDPDTLQSFLDEIFDDIVLPVSIKTRLGYSDGEEFFRLLEIFNRYPIAELIIHPRVRQDFYQNNVRMDLFEYARKNSRAPLCYNGNLCSKVDIRQFTEKYPSVDAVMLGRGLIGDPGMLSAGGTTKEQLLAFMNELFDAYAVAFGSSRNAMFRLKENWRHLFCLFEGIEKPEKQLRKTTDERQFRMLTEQIITQYPMCSQLQANW